MLLHAQKHNHAASQSTVPLMAYEDDVYKFHKKKNERKPPPPILLNYVEQIKNSLTHMMPYAQIFWVMSQFFFFSSFHFVFLHLCGDNTQIDRRG